MIPIFQNSFFELGILRHFLKGVCFFNCKSLYLKDHDSHCCYQSSIYSIMIIISDNDNENLKDHFLEMCTYFICLNSI